MSERIICNVCGQTYKDEGSIDMAKHYAEQWKKDCAADGIEAKGLWPCPNISCKGEMVSVPK